MQNFIQDFWLAAATYLQYCNVRQEEEEEVFIELDEEEVEIYFLQYLVAT